MKPTLRMAVLASAALLALSGCSSSPKAGWRVEPTFRVDHATKAGAGRGYLALARQYEGEGRWAQALQAHRKAALEAPADVEILNTLAQAEAGQGHHDRAVDALRRASVLAPQQVHLFNNLGYALILAGRADEARDVLRHALAMDPVNVRAQQNLEQAQAVLDATRPAPVSPPVEAAPPAPQQSNDPPVTALQVFTAPTVAPLAMARREDAKVAAVSAPQAAPVVVATPEPAAVPTAVSMPVAAPVATLMPATAAVPAPAEPATTPRPRARVEITNGNGVRGMAAWLAGWLRGHGVEGRSRLTNLKPFTSATTVVQYRPGFAEQAQEIAQRMPTSVQVAPDPRATANADVRIVLGHDLRSAKAVAGALVASR